MSPSVDPGSPMSEGGNLSATPWSALDGHLEGFLSDEGDPLVGRWAEGQGPDSPDRIVIRDVLQELTRASVTAKPLLEVGCGAGIEAVGLRSAGLLTKIAYHGVDFTPEMVRTCQDAHPDLKFTQASVYELGASGLSADIVLARHVLEHVPDVKEALAQLWRAANETLIISWFIRPSWFEGDVHTEEITLDTGRGVAHFLQATYGAPDLLAYLHDEIGVAACTRFDFDHIEHSCSIWIMSREPGGGKAGAALHQAGLTARFLDAVAGGQSSNADQSPLSSARQTIEELRSWVHEVEEARDYWKNIADSSIQ